MSDSIEASLRKLENKLDLAAKDFNDLKRHIADIASPNTQVELLLAGTNSRLDLVDERLARIADRLDLLRHDLHSQDLHSQAVPLETGK
jgi:septal ring factor EnvC (AmiA/AmiB activator)